MSSRWLAIPIALLGIFVSSPSAAACTKDQASAIYARARKAFDEKHYDESISLLREANACEPNPVYFANIARAFEEANKPKDAIQAWKDYQGVSTDPKEKSRAQGRINALTKIVEENEAREKKDKEAADAQRQKQNEDNASKQPPPTPKERPPEPTRSISIPGLIVAGIGVVGIGVGIGLGAAARSKHDSAVAEPNVVTARGLQDDAEGLSTAANISIIAGGIVAAAGVAWIAIDYLGQRETAVGVAVNGRGLWLRGTF